MKNILYSIVILFSFFCYSQANFEATGLAPNFFGYDLDNNYQELENYLEDGKIVVLEFMNINCGACQAYAPYLKDFYDEYGPNGSATAELIALDINIGSTDSQCLNFIEEYEVSYPLINGNSTMLCKCVAQLCSRRPGYRFVKRQIY